MTDFMQDDPEFFQLGVTNAEVAIDQVDSHDSLKDALDDYFDNLSDTLTEKGVKEWDNRASSAHRGFLSVLEKSGITHRPHGLTY